LPFAVDATILQRRINPEQTARFELRFTWQGEEAVEYRFGNYIPFGEPKYSEEPPGLIVTHGEKARQNDRTWLPETDDGGYVGGPQASASRELAPGESVAGTWMVWGDPREVSHIEPDSYRFEDKTVPSEDEDGEVVTWTFTTAIEKR